MLKKWLFASLLLSCISFTYAAIEAHQFDNEEQRHRYQHFLEELRCPLCKNQNLAGTNSQIAIDLRRELHRMILEGVSDQEIIDFMVSRYGEFVLYRPPVESKTIALWFAPVLFLLIGGIAIGMIVWRRRHTVNSVEQLSEAEKNQLATMLSTPDNLSNGKNKK